MNSLEETDFQVGRIRNLTGVTFDVQCNNDVLNIPDCNGKGGGYALSAINSGIYIL